MAELVPDCNDKITKYYKTQYLKEHPGIKEELGAKKLKTIFALLDSNPTISNKDLADAACCSTTTIYRIKKQHAQIHGITITNLSEMGEKIKTIIFDSLGENPNLGASQLAKLANCDVVTARKYRKQYTTTHEGIIIEDPKILGIKNKA